MESGNREPRLMMSLGEARQSTRADMAEEDNTIRLAIGAFYAPDKLDTAILDLFVNGLTTREICLAGTRRAFQQIVHAKHERPFHERSALLRARPLLPLSSLDDASGLLATSGFVHRTLFQEFSHRPGTKGSVFGDGDGLSNHMSRNAIALLVLAPTAELQHRSSRTLLHHSEHTVQTYEFSAAKVASSQ